MAGRIAYTGGVVLNGLVFSLDPNKRESYPGTGTTLYDLSDAKSTFTISGPVIGLKGTTPCFVLDSDGDNMTVTFGSNKSLSQSATLEAWIYPDAVELTDPTGRATIMMGSIYLSWNKGSNRISSYWYGKSPAGYHEPATGVSRGRWHHFVSVWDYVNSRFYQYVNGAVVTDIACSGTGDAVGSLVLGRESSARQFAGGFGAMRAYDRALSAAEVLQNFNDLRGRYGI
jgi:hypothetical protein